jgi:hypothetical protein
LSFDLPEAGLRLDQLAGDFSDPDTARVWIKVLDKVVKQEMPPADCVLISTQSKITFDFTEDTTQMPARDLYHDSVRSALEKDGWTITHDPFTMEFGKTNVFVDLAAEKLLSAEKSGRSIVVEVKTFGGPSRLADLEQALGQFALYRTILKRVSPERILFLAIADDVFEDFFVQEAVQAVVKDQSLKLLVFSPQLEEVIQWID